MWYRDKKISERLRDIEDSKKVKISLIGIWEKEEIKK